MSNPEEKPGVSWPHPWRSATVAWLVALLTLLAGVPLFLCMPPWNDVTLHDMAARSILRGGVHYRDVFDTNLPGIDWAMALIRSLFGWSYEVLRAFDLLVVGSVVAVVCFWLRHCGIANYTIAWFVAATAMFYPFTSEFNHVQRDVWLLLPAVIAAWLRVKQVERGGTGKPLFRDAVLEGFVWGLAVWVKPHVLIPALAVWVTSVVLLSRSESRKRLSADFAGLLLGGILAGLPGVLWLVATGAWPYFLNIFLNWNPSYLADSFPLADRLHKLFTCFGVWSLLHFGAIPLAVVGLWNARTHSPRALLAAFYLAWLVQAVFVQKPFEYVHVPLLLLGMALVASQRWCFGFAYLVWFVAIGVLVNVSTQSKIEPHTLSRADVVKLWPRCWSEGSSPEIRDQLGQFTNTAWGTNWRELNDVADYLRTVDPPLGPGELNCWHDTTHPLYLMLDLDPATRYMHYGTAFGIPSKRDVIAEEVRASRQKYVVSDLLRTTWHPQKVYDPASWREGDPLPVWLPANERAKFPWNQPVVFRSGRYVVHKVEKPLGVIRVPDWGDLDRLGELKSDE